jgi:integrase/recombinase XerC/integrase/recombinase XerD
MLISDCLNNFIQLQHLKNNSSATIADYSLILNKFIDYCGNVDSFLLTADIVNNYNIYLLKCVKPVSARTYIRHIRVFINFCIHKGYCNNIYNDIVIPKQTNKVIDILTPSQVEVLLCCFSSDYYGIRNKCMILLMLDSGLRASEVVTLKLDNINLDYHYIKVIGKGNKERIVPVGLASTSLLCNYLKIRPVSDSNFLFLTFSGKVLQRTVFKKLFRKLRKQSGIKKLYPHLLRHTFATNYLLYSDGDIYKLSMLLGHSDVKTTEIYLHYANYYSFMQHKRIYSFIDDLQQKQTT